MTLSLPSPDPSSTNNTSVTIGSSLSAAFSSRQRIGRLSTSSWTGITMDNVGLTSPDIGHQQHAGPELLHAQRARIERQPLLRRCPAPVLDHQGSVHCR